MSILTRKKIWIRFAISLFPAVGTGALLCWLLAGPRLFPHYDFLLRLRPAPPVSGEIRVIDTSGHEGLNSVLEPSAAASVLLTLTEMEAESLIIQTPVLGLSAPSSEGEEAILRGFEEEFALLGRNIRSLFDGIRLGSIGPAEAAGFVSELVELTERGKERLVSTYLRQNQEGGKRLKKAAALFGAVRQPEDLLVQVIRSGEDSREEGRAGAAWEGEGQSAEYFRAQPDKDGVLRRVSPFLPAGAGQKPTEHIVYSVLKKEFQSSEIEVTRRGQVLRNLTIGGRKISIPLDRNRSILVEPPQGDGFRTLSLSSFLDYEEEDRNLRRILEEAGSLGIYQGVPGENNPLFLYDYALSLMEDLLEHPSGGDKRKWIEARDAYFKSLDEFLYGPVEMNLVSGYEEILAMERLNEQDTIRIRDHRDSLIRTFVRLREKYNQIGALRRDLAAGLQGAFCILGPPDMDTQASALLANALLAGAAAAPWPFRYTFMATAVWAFVVCHLIRRMRAFRGLMAGLGLALLGGIIFAWVFVLSGQWFDPIPPMSAAVAGAIVSFLYAVVLKTSMKSRFRFAYGPFVSPSCLKRIISKARPQPEEILSEWAAVVVVKDSTLFARVDKGSSREGAAAVLEFQRRAAEYFRKAGAAVTGCEGDMILACFGSPPERVSLENEDSPSPYGDLVLAKHFPALKAWGSIVELLKRPDVSSWRFALDAGDCCFSWSRLGGYSAFGRPLVRCRILASLFSRYKVRVIISSRVNELLADLPVRKLNILKDKTGLSPEPFFEPIIQGI